MRSVESFHTTKWRLLANASGAAVMPNDMLSSCDPARTRRVALCRHPSTVYHLGV